ncbi:MAG: cobaltochelatase subunit CobN [Desulfitobacteriaceae bacterium]|nr:cobaltochelatase subunit CobN [Desulfitobacteriaceae bacterium]MDI6879841.1 cobaltochelatase subunit CobN [Desulfitobacteriaceae bacterium]MDI6915291.1 cobaltochelatase subunit CobN [Desulfitobacteriaceae bacterium]
MFKMVCLFSDHDSSYSMKEAYHAVCQDYPGEISLDFWKTSQIDGDPNEWLSCQRVLAEADLVFLVAHSGLTFFKKLESIVEIVQERETLKFFVHSGVEEENEELKKKSGLTAGQHQEILSYFLLSGLENHRNLLLYLATTLGRKRYNYHPVQRRVWEGIYAPGLPEERIEDETSYLANLKRSGKPVIGILFHSHYLQEQNLEHIEALIREIQALGGEVLPVFTESTANPLLGSKGLSWTLEHFFLDAREARVDALINTMGFAQSIVSRPGDGRHVVEESVFAPLAVPVLQAMPMLQSLERWEGSVNGLDGMSLVTSVYYPEFDGQIITAPIAYLDHVSDRFGERNIFRPIPERVRRVTSLALNWAKLRRTPPAAKRVAILFHNMPPRNDRIGCAFGLDTPASVWYMVQLLKEEGLKLDYDFQDGDEIIQRIIQAVSNDTRWLMPEEALKKSVARISGETFQLWNGELSPRIQEKLEKDWGKAPGQFMVYEDQLPVPGILNGHLFIGLQPARGYEEQAEAVYHSTDIAPPHAYLAYYRWLREVFGAQVIVHVGTHGSLEWLPGKEVGLSQDCFPDAAIADLPHLYPYIIDVTGEGIQVKRRSYGVLLDHLIPSLTRSGVYEELAVIVELIQDYEQAERQDPAKLPYLEERLWELVQSQHLDEDLQRNFQGSELQRQSEVALDEADRYKLVQTKLARNERPSRDFPAFVKRLHVWLEEIKSSLIKDGLHVFGQVPEGDRFIHLMQALLRLPNGEVPSLPQAVAAALGFDHHELYAKLTERAANGQSHLRLLDLIDEKGEELLWALHEAEYHPERIKGIIQEGIPVREASNMPDPLDFLSLSEPLEFPELPAKPDPQELLQQAEPMAQMERQELAQPQEPLHLKPLEQCLTYAATVVKKRLEGTKDELRYFREGIRGRFVPPGGSGSPTRGRVSILPTGRNFYALDPATIPSRSSWEVGCLLGQRLLERHLAEEGKYPENSVMVVYAGETMKTGGDDLAEALYLMGLKPKWLGDTERVIGQEVIPLGELGRPRLDVTLRITGLFRDTFPNLIERFDEAVQLAAGLDEPGEENYIRKHILEEIRQLEEKGHSRAQAEEEAGMRVFGCPPGTYGGGVDVLINSRNWQSQEDLGNVYTLWSGYAYGRKLHGRQVMEVFARRLAEAEATIKNEFSQEIDMLEDDCYYIYHGGLIAGITTHSGKAPRSYSGDASDPERPKVRDIREETARIMRARIFNPKWFAGLQQHGYKGAQEIAAMVDIAFGWDATAQVLQNWMYDQMAAFYLLNEERREWIREVNPWALHQISERLQEAAQRGMWEAGPEALQALRRIYLESEGDMEGA